MDQRPVSFISYNRKPSILHGQIWPTHKSDVVGLSSSRQNLREQCSPVIIVDAMRVAPRGDVGWRLRPAKAWSPACSFYTCPILVVPRCLSSLLFAGYVPPFTHSALKRAVRLMMPAVRRRLHRSPHGSSMHLSKQNQQVSDICSQS